MTVLNKKIDQITQLQASQDAAKQQESQLIAEFVIDAICSGMRVRYAS